MESRIEKTAQWGNVLWLWDENTQVGIALEFGIRVVHLSCTGMENLYYVQPADLSDGFTTPGGWRLYGGHRIWMAPESDDTYAPDNAPVVYTLLPDGARITQAPDPVLGIVKELTVTFQPDGGVRLLQSVRNATDKPLTGASWGINTLDAGGTAYIQFTNAGRAGYTPHRMVSLWSDTNLHDPRLCFGRTTLTARYMDLPEYLKLGLYCLEGKAVFENKGQRLTVLFDTPPMDRCPDNGCNFELYMCSRFVELETLGVRACMQPGESTNHVETWYLSHL